MITDNPNDPWAEIRRLQERLRRLETASPVENASISRGGIRALVPGGDGADGESKLGRAGGKIGFLIKSGGAWKTVPEIIDEKVAQGTDYPNARITDLEGRMGSAEAGIQYTSNRVGDVEGRTGGLEGRMAAAEGDIAAVPGLISASHTYPNARISDLEGRMGNAESSIADKASQKALDVANSSLDAARAKLNTLIQAHNSKHPDAPVSPLG